MEEIKTILFAPEVAAVLTSAGLLITSILYGCITESDVLEKRFSRLGWTKKYVKQLALAGLAVLILSLAVMLMTAKPSIACYFAAIGIGLVTASYLGLELNQA